jgi:hypothetical protein
MSVGLKLEEQSESYNRQSYCMETITASAPAVNAIRTWCGRGIPQLNRIDSKNLRTKQSNENLSQAHRIVVKYVGHRMRKRCGISAHSRQFSRLDFSYLASAPWLE